MSSWAPAHLTFEECQQIMADSYRDLGMAPNPSFAQRMSPEWSEEFHSKMKAWREANPSKPWGLDRMIEAGRKKGEQLRAKDKA